MQSDAPPPQTLADVYAELTPESLRASLPEGEDEMESENGDDGRAQLAELPEGLRTLAGELRALKVQSTRLAKVPAWVGELSQLEALELDGGGDGGDMNIKLRTLPAEIGQLGALKQLTIQGLHKLEAMPDTLGRMTSLESLKIDYCPKLKTVPASIGQVVTLKKLTLSGLPKLRAMPDASGLTSLEILTIDDCDAITALPAGLFQLGALKQLTLSLLLKLQAMPDASGLTSLEILTIDYCYKLTVLPAGLFQLGRSSSSRFKLWISWRRCQILSAG